MTNFDQATSSSSATSPWMTWRDVFLQNVQPMLAVVLLMRFSSIVDEAGFAITLSIVFVTYLVCFVTGWSACTVVSRNNNQNGFLKTMISYSTIEFATSFSIVYLFCLILATSMFVNTGAESVLHIFSTFDFAIFDGATNDLRLVASVISALVIVLTLVRQRQARLVRFFIFALTIIAIALHLSGVMLRYGEYQLHRIPEVNVLIPSPPTDEISTVFAQLFPAAICGLSIMNFGQKLQPSAPRGTLLAIAISAALYGAAAMLDYVEFFARSGANQTHSQLPQNELQSYIYTTVPMALVVTSACILSAQTTLKYAASLLQSLGRALKSSNLLWLSRGYASRDIPLRCLLLLSFCQILISLIGSYDILCIPTTVFYLVAYAIFNFYVFLVTIDDSDTPSPPAFVSLLISAICMFCAIYTNRHFALLAAFLFAISYCWQIYSSRDQKNAAQQKATMYVPTLEQMHQLQQEPDNSRHYHPQILLLTGSPAMRPALVDFAHSITRGKSLLICGYVIPQKPCSRSYLLQLKIDKQINDWLRSRDVNAFGSAICCENQADGANTLLQTVGLGRLRPNILMLGFKTNWDKMGISNLTIVNEYYGMLSNAFEKQVGLIVFRNDVSGFDVSSSIRKNGEPINGDEELAEYVESTTPKVSMDQNGLRMVANNGPGTNVVGGQKGKLLNSMQTTFRKMSMATTKDVEKGGQNRRESNRFQVIDKHSISEPDQKIILSQMYRFRKKIPNARIDVYWLREAGGLTMLVPYLITHAGSFLEGAHLRVFTKSDDKNKNDMRRINEEQKNMASVLRKFKIDSSDLHILPEFHKPPTKKITDIFNAKIAPFKVPRGVDKLPGMFDEDQLFTLREKTRSFLRAAELITENSSDADLICCTLPSARPDIPAALYLSWIDILSQQIPPTCLVRGNQVSISALNLKFP